MYEALFLALPKRTPRLNIVESIQGYILNRTTIIPNM